MMVIVGRVANVGCWMILIGFILQPVIVVSKTSFSIHDHTYERRPLQIVMHDTIVVI